MGLSESHVSKLGPSRPDRQRGEGGPPRLELSAAKQVHTVRQEPNLVFVETQVGHVTTGISFHQILRSQRKVPDRTSPKQAASKGPSR